MSKGKNTAVRERLHHFFVVRVPAVDRKRFLQNYVRDALRGWAGGGHPDDPLFKEARKIVVKNSLYEMERETLMNLRKDLSRLLFSSETYVGEHAEQVDALLLSYISRS